MKDFITQIDYQGMPKGTVLKPVPGYPDVPGTYATEAELQKKPPTNFWYLSFILEHPEVFKEITQ
jgi:hypothetical protein